MIKFHGWQIAPAELEAVLLTHPQVINAAIIGIPLNDGTGEVPQAFVVLKPRPLDGTYASHGDLEEQTTTEEELKSYLASRLAKYKALNGVTFVDDIPRTASGKLQKFKLKELYLDLSKSKKRKGGVLETIADRNAAISNGTSDPIDNGSPASGIDDSKDVKQDRQDQGLHYDGSPTRKRVKVMSNEERSSCKPLSEGDRVNTDGSKCLSNGYDTYVKEFSRGKSETGTNGNKPLINGHVTRVNGTA